MMLGRRLAPLRRRIRPRRRFSSEETVRLTFVDPGGKATEVAATVGKTVLDAALAHDVDIEAACGGEMACSTCHVILEQEHFDSLGTPAEEEQDMCVARSSHNALTRCRQAGPGVGLDGHVAAVLPAESDARLRRGQVHLARGAQPLGPDCHLCCLFVTSSRLRTNAHCRTSGRLVIRSYF